MGNINRIGRESKIKRSEEESEKESVKGTASSKETKAASASASEAAIQQNAEAFRKLLVEKFGKEYGPKIADALDDVKRSGKFVTYEEVKRIMENVFANDKKAFDNFEKQRNEIVGLFPFENQFVGIKPKDDYDPYLSALQTIAAMQKELRRSDERSSEKMNEEDKERQFHKEKDEKQTIQQKRILHPDKKV